MEKQILNSKIYFELLPDEEQAQRTVFTPNADMMKKASVINVGSKVEFVKEKDIIEIYSNSIVLTEGRKGFCSERDVIFTNSKPPIGKIHINEQSTRGMTVLTNANVISSNADDVEEGDRVYYKAGQSHILPDHTEIISESQVYYKQ